MLDTSPETTATRSRYERIAPLYDNLERIAERYYAAWRAQLWELVNGPRVLEVGVGTGKNMPYYPAGVQVTAIDLTPGMLERARDRKRTLRVPVKLELDDVQELGFPDDSFDDIVSTFVFCSVPDPVRGLRELARVAQPEGRLLMLEHVRAPQPLLGAAMNVLNPLVVRIIGANINRDTVGNVRRAGWTLERVADLDAAGIFKLIVAHQ